MPIDSDSINLYLAQPDSMHLAVQEGVIRAVEGNKNTDARVHAAHITAFKALREESASFQVQPLPIEECPVPRSLLSFISSLTSLFATPKNPTQILWESVHSCEYAELFSWRDCNGKQSASGKYQARHTAITKIIQAYENSDTVLDLSHLKLGTLPSFIGNLSELRILNCELCCLKDLPDSIGGLKRLRELKLSHNSLRRLPESIGNLNQLSSLNLTSNTLPNLPESVGELHLLRLLYLAGNPLTSLPDSLSNLSALEVITLRENCFAAPPLSLLELIQSRAGSLNMDVREIAEGSTSFVVNRTELLENPFKYLKILALGGIPAHIAFEKMPAIDAGGVSKQFIHDLCQALLDNNFLKINDVKLPAAEAFKDLDAFTIYGQFLVKLEKKNRGKSDPIFTGRLFNDAFFNILKAVITDGLERSKKEAVAGYVCHVDLIYKPFYDFIKNPSPQEAEIQYIKSQLETLGEEFNEGLGFDEQRLKNLCLSRFDIFYKAALALSVGLDEPLKGFIIATPIAVVSSQIQGQALDKIRFASSFIYAQTSPVIAQKISWIAQKIVDDITPASWCEKLLFAITGQKVMGPVLQIKVSEGSSPIPSSRTCFNQLFLDATPLSKKQFYKNLEMLVDTTDLGLT
jgi:hypothetical protein